ncbi:unnamed protein product [Rotaria socialis]|uniref:CBM21 domain-containing protein n=1 Tax=Rotaria socialis TaxID=392032 RepID=A0A817WE49_9BILA|nr:unnamed protein product [Rotaria socialis]CAF3401317.1 unnamed protein product [Rotaria socialis]CAF3422767.1 unnamed protein product [Rotaria socialis]CAF4231970.1 unnamed protein product [Rotaria socialis]CAF4276621.1 unnamed protein product [Rotaria socialis]
MATEQQGNSSDICQINGVHDQHLNQTGDDKVTNSSDATSRHSRFFRTKRKQRLGENLTSVNGQIKIDIPIDHVSKSLEKLKIRSSSPLPSSLAATDDSDESDESNPGVDFEKIPKIDITPARPSIMSINTGFQLKKSHSAKLTRANENESCPKKAVRFADDFGLDLSQIKVIKTDELPYVPRAAFKDLHVTDESNSSGTRHQEPSKLITYMDQQFSNPIYAADFNDRVSRQKIILEQANAIDNRIYGTIKLVSFSLQKRVKVRLTTDNWISFQDHEATYITNSYDGTYDRFSFTIEVDRYRICAGNNIQFSICYTSFAGPELWDNNYDQNYRFDCLSRTIPDYRI